MASRTTRARPQARALSLHIGLNLVDPKHYGGWSGPRAACEFDANIVDTQTYRIHQGVHSGDQQQQASFICARFRSTSARLDSVSARLPPVSRWIAKVMTKNWNSAVPRRSAVS